MEKPTILIIGLGWASVAFLKTIDTSIYNVEVYSLDNTFTYTPYLAQNILHNKNLSLEGKDINKEVKYISREISKIDFKNDQIISKNNEKNSYDYLILSHGAVTNTFNIKGVEKHCSFLKNSYHVDNLREKIKTLPEHSHIAVIGCGLTGTELIGTLIDHKKFNIHAIDALPRPITMFDEKLSNYTLNLWKKNNVTSYMNHMVSSIDAHKINFKNDEPISYQLAIWCGGIKKSSLTDRILHDLNLNDKRGISVNKYLEIPSVKHTYAMGDCAYSGFPPTAQVASQQGHYLALQFNDKFKHKKPFEFKNKGQIGYVGNKQSVCQLPYFQSGGNIVYYLNQAIHVYNCINWKQRYNFIKSE